MNHLKTWNAYFGAGSYKNRKYNSKELQETGMYSYGWRDYMPDIARWNGIDQLAESYLSTSTYAYVANNPVSYADVDGRWFNEDGSIDTSGHTPGFTTGHQYQNSFLGVNPGQGGGGGGNGYTFTGTAAGFMFNYFANGGNINGISFNNGYAKFWTGTATQTSYRIGDDLYGEGDPGVMHTLKLEDFLDYANFANDRIDDASSILKNRPNQGGSIAFWTTSAGGRSFDGINYSRFNLRYYRNNWSGNGYTGATRSVAKYLNKGALVGQIVLGAIEVGNGVANDYNDYNQKGVTYGRNTAVASAKVAAGIAGAYYGAMLGTALFPGVGTAAGIIVGGIGGYIAAEISGATVETVYDLTE